jgi:cytochrome c-type biogenesis protein
VLLRPELETAFDCTWAVLLWAPARRAIDRMAALSGRVPVAIGLLFVALGAWSVYFGLFVTVQM